LSLNYDIILLLTFNSKHHPWYHTKNSNTENRIPKTKHYGKNQAMHNQTRSLKETYKHKHIQDQKLNRLNHPWNACSKISILI